MMDQHKEQYKKEMEQIHAPTDLIERTKAAMREEEARIQRECMKQTAEESVREAGFAAQKKFPVQKTGGWGAAARKWLYPLTAVAAILILISVSVTMRGLGKAESGSTAYEAAKAPDRGAGESALEEAVEEAAFEEETDNGAADVEMTSTEEGGVADDVGMAEAADSVSETTGALDERAEDSDKAAAKAESLERAMSEKEQETVTDYAATTNEITIKRVLEKPAFVDRADIEIRIYEDTVFQVIKEGESWTAYVESDSGAGYVICGEGETIEAFLEAGYQKLLATGF